MFQPGDVDGLTRALEQLIQDPALRATIARNAAAVARDEFPIERNVQRAEALYESLITGRGVVRPVTVPHTP
jgi:glycosyltransferase involved in cell wall biosynthesis